MSYTLGSGGKQAQRAGIFLRKIIIAAKLLQLGFFPASRHFG
jgi:hypothetical protein